MPRTLAPVFSLLLATAILLIGNGLLGTLIPIRAGIDGFAITTVGVIGSVYFAGFLVGCMATPHVVHRAGHIRSFAAFCGLASVAPLIHALSSDPFIWGLMRILTGFCFAGLYMVIESWLNEQSTNETRGRFFSTYVIVNLSALTVGQFMLNAADPGGFALFAVCSILTSLALVPVALTTSVQPMPIQSTRIDVWKLYALSPVGLIGSFVVGLTNAPFWTLAPLYASESGLDMSGISLFMAAAIIGGAIAQWPIGRLSDQMDRRRVIVVVSIGAALGEIALVIAGSGGSVTAVMLAGFLFGVFGLTLYSVCVAHMNDHGQSESFVAISGGLLIVFSIGSIIGPTVASIGVSTFGIASIFLVTATVHLLFAAYTGYRITSAPALTGEQRSDFVAVPFTQVQPLPTELDPRASDEALAPEEASETDATAR
ncbi:major facilitator superfamily MFS_1 [Parvibaculum lavamentivorans DS-1]|uniref:Major facilitator superfamily MFS_1 n=1 Tax=Parvibaculum lavamentivorans (strain DS-1 / DSM 13023 / NCIMB 13966) TaxID=402881 RepID=A7HY50_PARL1|nr:MFS transporter [Parvibaculum lavamentivorans]ABS64833.1 major facilitator superfamily MFS_1 [Parvibaculum lavamentivorans DS-1]